jgi:hypothetical protein
MATPIGYQTGIDADGFEYTIYHDRTPKQPIQAQAGEIYGSKERIRFQPELTCLYCGHSFWDRPDFPMYLTLLCPYCGHSQYIED